MKRKNYEFKINGKSSWFIKDIEVYIGDSWYGKKLKRILQQIKTWPWYGDSNYSLTFKDNDFIEIKEILDYNPCQDCSRWSAGCQKCIHNIWTKYKIVDAESCITIPFQFKNLEGVVNSLKKYRDKNFNVKDYLEELKIAE